jgi:hypothetical protein
MTSLILFLITIHWSFMLGAHLALITRIKVYQICLFVIVLRYFLQIYGYK